MNRLKQQLIFTALAYKMDINLIIIIVDDQLNYPEYYGLFIDDMDSIGWAQLFQRRVSIKWNIFIEPIKRKRKRNVHLIEYNMDFLEVTLV